MARRRRRKRGAPSSAGWRPPAWLVVTLLVGGGIGPVVVMAFSLFGEPAPESEAAIAAVSERYSVPLEGAQHVDEGVIVARDHYPPSSGDHYANPSNYGVFEEPVPEGAWIHNLEHGGIVVLYPCDADCGDRADEIRKLYRSLPDGLFGEVKLVATPYDRVTAAYTLLAWGWQEDLDEFDAGRVERFYRDMVDRGPERAH